jgi:hypothetical protein
MWYQQNQQCSACNAGQCSIIIDHRSVSVQLLVLKFGHLSMLLSMVVVVVVVVVGARFQAGGCLSFVLF